MKCVNCFGDGWLPRGIGQETCPRCQGSGDQTMPTLDPIDRSELDPRRLLIIEANEAVEADYQAVIRAGVDDDLARKLSPETVIMILADLDAIEDDYETFADMVASGPPEHIGTVTTLDMSPPFDDVPF